MKNINEFQAWLNESIYDSVRFYPMNTSEYSVSEMLESAFNAVRSYEAGIFDTYKPTVQTTTTVPTFK